MTDADAIKQLIVREKPDFIIPEIEAEGLARAIPNARAVQLTMNREGIRTMAAEEIGVATSSYAFAKTFEELKTAVDNGIGYPCFIKPTMSSSGKGQSMVTTEDQLKAAWKMAKSGGRADTGKVIVEGAVDFDYEITLLTVRALNEHGEVDTYFCVLDTGKNMGITEKAGNHRK